MTQDEIKDLLRQKSDYRKVDFAGEREFILGKRAFDIAKQREGLEPEDVVGGEKDGDSDLSANLGRAAKLIYVGLLPFDDSLELEVVEELITFADAKMVGELMNDLFGDMTPEEPTAGKE